MSPQTIEKTTQQYEVVVKKKVNLSATENKPILHQWVQDFLAIK